MKRLALLLLVLTPVAVPGEEAVPVTVRALDTLLFRPEQSAPAEVVPLNDARLSAEINARVLEMPARVGDRVEAGDPLARLDCRLYQSRLAAQRSTRRALETRLQLARTQLRRARDLKRQSNISDEEVDRRDTELLALQAELDAQREAEAQAGLDVERCDIRAPYRAVVSERLASVGDLAAPGTPLVRLVQLDGAEVSARVRPDEAEGGAQARSIEFAYLGERYPLEVLRVLPVVDPRTRTVEVRFTFAQREAPPGASGRVRWRSRAPHLPADLVVRREGRLGVFLFNDGHAHFHALEDALEGQPARWDSGREAMVIVSGRHGLRDGQAVRETREAAADPP